MKAILMSIQSKWLAKILNGEKTIELRKRFPKDYRGWVYLYCTKAKPYLADFGDNEYPYKSGGYECSFDLSNIEKHDAKVLNGKVVCRFWVDNVEEITVCSPLYEQHSLYKKYKYLGELETSKIDLLEKACVNADELTKYLYNEVSEELYEKFCAIHFSKLGIFDKPKELGELKTAVHYPKNIIQIYLDYKPLTKAPQSWQYVEVEE